MGGVEGVSAAAVEIALLALANRNVFRNSRRINHRADVLPVLMAGAVCPLALSAVGKKDARLGASADHASSIIKIRGLKLSPVLNKVVLLASCLPFILSSSLHATVPAPAIHLERVPDGGIQPQTVVDKQGTVHLIYFKGDPSAGDLFYARSSNGSNFSHPIRVNSVAGSAVAVGTIRGARIAVGREGRVYVAWNGSRNVASPGQRFPMLFARLNDQGTAFEPERNLIHEATGVDGGGGIAADQRGDVYVFWHAPMPGTTGENNRRVWMAKSENDGKTFAPERIIWNEPTGACACCSLTAFANRAGTLFVLFRSAEQMVHRDIYLLESQDRGRTFRGSDASKWNVGYCVMSSEAFAADSHGTFAAWETEKRVHFGRISPATATVADLNLPDPGTDQKYPSLATDKAGLLLVSWTEGMGWKKGGSLHWQVFDSSLHPVGQPGSAAGVPVWSLPTAYPLADGSFKILY